MPLGAAMPSGASPLAFDSNGAQIAGGRHSLATQYDGADAAYPSTFLDTQDIADHPLRPSPSTLHLSPQVSRRTSRSSLRSSQSVNTERYSLYSLLDQHVPAQFPPVPAQHSPGSLSPIPGRGASANSSFVDIRIQAPDIQSETRSSARHSPLSRRASRSSLESRHARANASTADLQLFELRGDVATPVNSLSERYPEPFPKIPQNMSRYDRKVTIPDERTEFSIEPLTIAKNDEPTPQGWIVCLHPEGAQYFLHEEKKSSCTQRVFTDANLDEPEALEFIEFHMRRMLARLADLLRTLKKEPFDVDLVLDGPDWNNGCRYYFVDHEHRCIFWLDKIGADEFPITWEINGITSASQKWHILQAQYWYHCELYPHALQVTQEMLHDLGDMVLHAMGDLATSATSTVSFTVENLKHMMTVIDCMLYKLERCGNRYDGSSCLLGRFMFLFFQGRVYNFHGQPGARLDIDVSVYEKPQKRTLLIKLLSPLLFHAPESHLSRLHAICIDRLIRQPVWSKFIMRLNSEWQEFVMYATILLNANVAFLGIQSVDQGGPHRSAAQICSYLSIFISIGSIIIGLLLMKQNRDRADATVHEAAAFIAGRTHPTLGLETTAIIHSLPYALLIWSMVSFLAAFSFMCLLDSGRITQALVAVLGGGIMILIFWSIFAAWDSEGRNWGWNWLRQRLPSFKVTADAQSMHTDTSGPSRHRRWKRLRSLILHQNPPDPDSDQTDFRV